MGQYTRSKIITEGLLAAGDSSLTKRAYSWLNGWLRSNYAGFMWPFLMREKAGLELNQGEQTLAFGVGSGGETLEVRRLTDPMFIYDSGYTTRSNIRIRSFLNDNPLLDESVNDPANNVGLPAYVKVRPYPGTYGKWDLVFDKAADKNYLVKVSYVVQPADIAEDVSGDSTIPLYPNDRTMVKLIEVEALKYKKADNYPVEREVLSAMVVDDRMKYGEVPGINDAITLDPKVFR